MRALINPNVNPSESSPVETLVDMAILAGVVFVASLFGILTRPAGLLALFWPANAILLGLMIRQPRFATPLGWVTAFLAYVAADLITQGTVVRTLWLTSANIAGVFTGSLIYRFVSIDHRRLREPQSVIIMLVICIAAALASALVGGLAAGVALNKPYFAGFEFWMVTELVNFIVVLPVVLIAPPLKEWSGMLMPETAISWERNALPVATLILSMFVSSLLGGPGSFAFPVPALLWCAISFSLFPTALLTLVFSVWGMMVFSEAGVSPTTDYLPWVQSIRLGLGMIALAPLSVASVMTTRNFLLHRLQDSVDHDFLTRTLTRGTLMARGENTISQNSTPDGSAVLVLDIDYFKAVNDKYGHAAGDTALVAFATTVGASLRKDDLFGRTGGEEFCVVLPKTSPMAAQAVAERIRHAIEELEIDIGQGQPLRITVSGGLAVRTGVSKLSLDEMLTRADMALYRAKAEGRNRIVKADLC